MEEVEGDLIRLSSPKRMSSRCSKHGDYLRLYCDTCGKLICRDCTVQLHKDHRYSVITDTFESHKEEILASLKPIEKQLETTDRAIIRLDRRYKEIATKRVAVETEIHSAFEEIHKALDAREAELVAQLDDQTQEQLNKISAQRKEAEIHLAQCNNCVHFVQESICNGTPEDVLNMKAGVVKCIKDLIDMIHPSKLQPCEQATSSFIHVSDPLVKHCKEFGDLCNADIPRAGEVDKKVNAKFQLLSSNKLPAVEAQLVSRLTDQTTKCTVTKRGKGKFEITYKPTVIGAHQIRMRMGGEEVRGSPFPVTVKTPISKLGTVIKTIKTVAKPWGVAVNKSGEVIVVEEKAGHILIFSATGEQLLQTIDTQDTAAGRMKNPQGVAVDGDGNILVVDPGNSRLLKFSRAGDLIAAVGSEGDGPGQFKWPVSVCVNGINGKVYVVDSDAHCVYIFNSDLTFSSKFGSFGYGDAGVFNKPYGIATDSTGCVYVVNAESNRVKVFTAKGGYLRQFGSLGEEEGKLSSPVSICMDSEDLVYIGESWNHRISVFNREGEFVKSFGSYGSEPGQFFNPCGIAVGDGVVHVSDNGNKTVQLF